MQKDPEAFEEFEREFVKQHPLTLEQKYALLDAMYDLAVQFGHFTENNILDGIEQDIALAKALNANVSEGPR